MKPTKPLEKRECVCTALTTCLDIFIKEFTQEEQEDAFLKLQKQYLHCLPSNMTLNSFLGDWRKTMIEKNMSSSMEYIWIDFQNFLIEGGSK